MLFSPDSLILSFGYPENIRANILHPNISFMFDHYEHSGSTEISAKDNQVRLHMWVHMIIIVKAKIHTNTN